ncbi:hypothetical protein A9Q84_00750 [Halobacteriovorax marinus]|uniref:TraB/GumN family protein n=1 Tax=Halobacteriovorax marinus TaxID=97084 RepID=A0A1Y5FBJ3_9BACT|nr:hypothetical protein A9Q84_00750 [Halobacteriovorax marinus]
MKISILLGLLISFNVSAKVCNLEAGLTKKQIKVINKAKKIKRVGPNSALLGKHVYEVDVLSDKESNFVVLLGEAHIKGLRSSLIGKKVVKAFPVRMLEGVPADEVRELIRKNPEFAGVLGYQRVLARYLTFNFFGSTINVARKKGLLFDLGGNSVLEDKKVVLETTLNNAFDIMNSLESLSEYGKKGINLPLEIGRYIEPSAEDSYILDARNVRMAENIVNYTSADSLRIENAGAKIVIIGSAHNPGIVELLKETSNLEKCDNI